VNLATIIDEHPAAAAALMSRQRETTYGELRDQVARLRGGLAGLGLEPGDRVGIICANNWYFVASYLAVLSGGLVAVPLNPQSPAAELTAELAAVGARAVIVGPAGASAFAQVDRAGLVDLEHVVTTSGSDIDGALDFDELVAADPTPVIDREPDDLAVLVFTSGTAGAPKAAMLTHGSLLANLDQTQRHPGRAMTSDDISFGVLPLFHIFGLNVVLGLTLRAGARVVLVERFDPASALETIAERGVTVVAGAPPMWTAWLGLPDADPEAFSSVRLAVSGAARLPEDVAQAFERRFGVQLSEGYGLTEASPVVTSSAGDEPRYGSIGRPVPDLEVRLVDDDGEDALVGDTGEIWLRGPNIFAGYWEDPEATAAVLTPDGWLRTGDVAVADGDGYLYLVNRAKDVIIVSGFNVFPGEVEEVLMAHAGVKEAAVVGVAHPHTGEAVKAFVVVEAGQSFEEDLLIDFCADRLARYKCPSKVTFVDELPRGQGGKVLRRALR
jgi:long-chain acyl-CoA synthetase